MIQRRTNSVHGKPMTMPRMCATIVANMGISLMIVPNPQSSTRSKMMMTIKTSTQRKVLRKEDIKAFLGEWITDGESSSDDESKNKIVGIAMHR